MFGEYILSFVARVDGLITGLGQVQTAFLGVTNGVKALSQGIQTNLTNQLQAAQRQVGELSRALKTGDLNATAFAAIGKAAKETQSRVIELSKSIADMTAAKSGFAASTAQAKALAAGIASVNLELGTTKKKLDDLAALKPFQKIQEDIVKVGNELEKVRSKMTFTSRGSPVIGTSAALLAEKKRLEAELASLGMQQQGLATNPAAQRAINDLKAQQVALQQQIINKLKATEEAEKALSKTATSTWELQQTQVRAYLQSLITTGGMLSQIGGGMQRLGVAATAAGALFFAAGANVVKVGAAYQQSMDTARSVISNMNTGTAEAQQLFTQLEATVLKLAGTTKFTASEVAEGAKFLGQAGLSAQETMEALPAVLNLSMAGFVDLGRSAEIAADFMNAFQLRGSEVTRVVDILAKGEVVANTTLLQLANAFSFAAPVAASLGQSIEDTAAALSLLSNSGIKASRAGTGLAQIMSGLIRDTGKTAALMERYGSSFDSVNPQIVSIIDIIKEFKDVNVSAADVLEQFGERAGRAMLALMNAPTSKINEISQAINNSFGEGLRQATIRWQNLGGAIVEFTSRIELVKIGLFKKIEDDLRNVIVFLTKGLDQIVALLNNPVFSSFAKSVIYIGTALSAFAIVAGTTVAAVGTLFATVGGGITVFGSLALSAQASAASLVQAAVAAEADLAAIEALGLANGFTAVQIRANNLELINQVRTLKANAAAANANAVAVGRASGLKGAATEGFAVVGGVLRGLLAVVGKLAIVLTLAGIAIYGLVNAFQPLEKSVEGLGSGSAIMQALARIAGETSDKFQQLAKHSREVSNSFSNTQYGGIAATLTNTNISVEYLEQSMRQLLQAVEDLLGVFGTDLASVLAGTGALIVGTVVAAINLLILAVAGVVQVIAGLLDGSLIIGTLNFLGDAFNYLARMAIGAWVAIKSGGDLKAAKKAMDDYSDSVARAAKNHERIAKGLPQLGGGDSKESVLGNDPWGEVRRLDEPGHPQWGGNILPSKRNPAKRAGPAKPIKAPAESVTKVTADNLQFSNDQARYAGELLKLSNLMRDEQLGLLAGNDLKLTQLKDLMARYGVNSSEDADNAIKRVTQNIKGVQTKVAASTTPNAGDDITKIAANAEYEEQLTQLKAATKAQQDLRASGQPVTSSAALNKQLSDLEVDRKVRREQEEAAKDKVDWAKKAESDFEKITEGKLQGYDKEIAVIDGLTESWKKHYAIVLDLAKGAEAAGKLNLATREGKLDEALGEYGKIVAEINKRKDASIADIRKQGGTNQAENIAVVENIASGEIAAADGVIIHHRQQIKDINAGIVTDQEKQLSLTKQDAEATAALAERKRKATEIEVKARTDFIRGQQVREAKARGDDLAAARLEIQDRYEDEIEKIDKVFAYQDASTAKLKANALQRAKSTRDDSIHEAEIKQREKDQKDALGKLKEAANPLLSVHEEAAKALAKQVKSVRDLIALYNIMYQIRMDQERRAYMWGIAAAAAQRQAAVAAAASAADPDNVGKQNVAIRTAQMAELKKTFFGGALVDANRGKVHTDIGNQIVGLPFIGAIGNVVTVITQKFEEAIGVLHLINANLGGKPVQALAQHEKDQLVAAVENAPPGAVVVPQAFADGGIVKGQSKKGDKVLIRANAGEEVLTEEESKKRREDLVKQHQYFIESRPAGMREMSAVKKRDLPENPNDWNLSEILEQRMHAILDAPGAFARTAIDRKNPFPGIFDPSKRTTSRELLFNKGFIGPDEPGLDSSDLASLLAELAIDPTNYSPKGVVGLLGIGGKLNKASKAGEAAQGIRHLGDLAADAQKLPRSPHVEPYTLQDAHNQLMKERAAPSTMAERLAAAPRHTPEQLAAKKAAEAAEKAELDALILKAATPNEANYYSQLAKTVAGLKQDNFKGANGILRVKDLLGKGAGKAEINAHDIEGFLAGKENVTKKELLEHVLSKSILPTRDILGIPRSVGQLQWEQIQPTGGDSYWKGRDLLTGEFQSSIINERGGKYLASKGKMQRETSFDSLEEAQTFLQQHHETWQPSDNPAPFEEHITPGSVPGTYRVRLVTHPNQTTIDPKLEAAYIEAVRESGYYNRNISDATIISEAIDNRMPIYRISEGRLDSVNKYLDLRQNMLPWKDQHSAFKGIDNPSSELRTSEFNLQGGGKSLHANELQISPDKANAKRMPEYIQGNEIELAVKQFMTAGVEAGATKLTWPHGQEVFERWGSPYASWQAITPAAQRTAHRDRIRKLVDDLRVTQEFAATQPSQSAFSLEQARIMSLQKDDIGKLFADRNKLKNPSRDMVREWVRVTRDEEEYIASALERGVFEKGSIQHNDHVKTIEQQGGYIARAFKNRQAPNSNTPDYWLDYKHQVGAGEAEGLARGLITHQGKQRVGSLEELHGVIQSSASYNSGGEELAQKIWHRMQSSPSGTYLPRKEFFEKLYDEEVPAHIGKVFGKGNIGTEDLSMKYTATNVLGGNTARPYTFASEEDLQTYLRSLSTEVRKHTEVSREVIPAHSAEYTPEITKKIQKGFPAYAQGGVVQGSGEGVHVIAHPNEVILNNRQQGALEDLTGMSRTQVFGDIGVPGFAGKTSSTTQFADGGIVPGSGGVQVLAPKSVLDLLERIDNNTHASSKTLSGPLLTEVTRQSTIGTRTVVPTRAIPIPPRPESAPTGVMAQRHLKAEQQLKAEYQPGGMTGAYRVPRSALYNAVTRQKLAAAQAAREKYEASQDDKKEAAFAADNKRWEQEEKFREKAYELKKKSWAWSGSGSYGFGKAKSFPVPKLGASLRPKPEPSAKEAEEAEAARKSGAMGRLEEDQKTALLLGDTKVVGAGTTKDPHRYVSGVKVLRDRRAGAAQVTGQSVRDRIAEAKEAARKRAGKLTPQEQAKQWEVEEQKKRADDTKLLEGNKAEESAKFSTNEKTVQEGLLAGGFAADSPEVLLSRKIQQEQAVLSTEAKVKALEAEKKSTKLARQHEFENPQTKQLRDDKFNKAQVRAGMSDADKQKYDDEAEIRERMKSTDEAVRRQARGDLGRFKNPERGPKYIRRGPITRANSYMTQATDVAGNVLPPQLTPQQVAANKRDARIAELDAELKAGKGGKADRGVVGTPEGQKHAVWKAGQDAAKTMAKDEPSYGELALQRQEKGLKELEAGQQAKTYAGTVRAVAPEVAEDFLKKRTPEGHLRTRGENDAKAGSDFTDKEMPLDAGGLPVRPTKPIESLLDKDPAVSMLDSLNSFTTSMQALALNIPNLAGGLSGVNYSNFSNNLNSAVTPDISALSAAPGAAGKETAMTDNRSMSIEVKNEMDLDKLTQRMSLWATERGFSAANV